MIRNLIVHLIYFSGLPWLLRTVFLRNKITIIYYHKISPSLFEKHALFLKKWFKIISLKAFVENPLISTKWSLIITIDDGHKNNYLLLNTIVRLKLPVTIFLTTKVAGYKRRFWFLNMDERKKETLKKISDNERIEALERIGFKQDEEFPEGDGLTKEQINEMGQFVDFQSHTCSHPILPNCDNLKSKFEIIQSKLDIEELTGKDCYALAFPNGDFSKREVQYVQEAGYKAALNTITGSNLRNCNMYELKRISASDSGSIYELALRITGIWFFLKKIIKPT